MSFITTLIAIFAAGFGFGVVLPVTSVVLEQQHVATPSIGLMATIMFVGLALGAPLVGRSIELRGVRFTLVCRVEHDRSVHACAWCYGFSAAMVHHPFFYGHWIWRHFHLLRNPDQSSEHR